MAELGALRSGYDAWNRRDVEALVALADPDIEIEPLVAGLTSSGPWRGHDGIRRLVEDAGRHWHRLELRCDDFVELGDRTVVFVHVTTAVSADGPVVEGDVAHVLETRDGRYTRFIAYRDREAALRAAEAR